MGYWLSHCPHFTHTTDNHDVISFRVYDVDAPVEIPSMGDVTKVRQNLPLRQRIDHSVLYFYRNLSTGLPSSHMLAWQRLQEVCVCSVGLYMCYTVLCLYIAHVEDQEPVFSSRAYKVISYGLVILLVVGLVVVIGGIAFIKNQERSQKRFF